MGRGRGCIGLRRLAGTCIDAVEAFVEVKEAAELVGVVSVLAVAGRLNVVVVAFDIECYHMAWQALRRRSDQVTD